jgi:hypothetical protein
VPSTVRGGRDRSSRGDSGENEGNEVKDLSDIDDAELDMYEVYFRGLILRVCDRELFAEVFEWWDEDLWRDVDPTSRSIVVDSQQSRDSSSSQSNGPSYDNLFTVVVNASKWHETNTASVKAGLHKE